MASLIRRELIPHVSGEHLFLLLAELLCPVVLLALHEAVIETLEALLQGEGGEAAGVGFLLGLLQDVVLTEEEESLRMLCVVGGQGELEGACVVRGDAV